MIQRKHAVHIKSYHPTNIAIPGNSGNIGRSSETATSKRWESDDLKTAVATGAERIAQTTCQYDFSENRAGPDYIKYRSLFINACFHYRGEITEIAVVGCIGADHV